MGKKRSSARVAWGPKPVSTDPVPKLEMLRPGAGQTVQAMCLSPALHEVPTHHVSRRTVGCLGRTCTHCRQGLATRWYGYAHVQGLRSNTEWMMEVTDGCIGVFRVAFEAEKNLRGCIIKLQRLGDKDNGRVRATITRSAIGAETLPPEIDVQYFMERLWQSASRPVELADNLDPQKLVQNWNSDIHKEIAALRTEQGRTAASAEAIRFAVEQSRLANATDTPRVIPGAGQRDFLKQKGNGVL